jgi:TonB family protein
MIFLNLKSKIVNLKSLDGGFILALLIILFSLLILLHLLFSNTENIVLKRLHLLQKPYLSVSSSGVNSGSDNKQTPSAIIQPPVSNIQLPTSTYNDQQQNLPEISKQPPPPDQQLNIDDQQVFTSVEQNPSFPGGERARIKFLQSNIKYPHDAISNHIDGKIIISFIVEKDGSLSSIKALNSIGSGCEDEAIRVTKLMPKWNPGKQSGNPVRVYFNMPITFSLKPR